MSIHDEFDEALREIATHKAEMSSIQKKGEQALRRLLPIAQGSSGQCKYVARFLLGCYNGARFPFDLTDFRVLDRKIFDDCMAVLRMDYMPAQEVHLYFENGGNVFEKLAEDWGIRDQSLTT